MGTTGTTCSAEAGRRERQAARLRLIAGMRAGQGWRAAAREAGLEVSRTTAYRVARQGDGAAYDRRRGHADKLGGAVRVWLEDYCRAGPDSTGGQIQAALRARCGPPRRQYQPDQSGPRHSRLEPTARGGNREASPPPEPGWQDGAGGLLLLAAAHETGLLGTLGRACSAPTPDHSPSCMSSLLCTLLFLNAVGLRRTWDLRGYTGDSLALLTGRDRAYGYRHSERVLAARARRGRGGPHRRAGHLGGRAVATVPPAGGRPAPPPFISMATASPSTATGCSRVAWSPGAVRCLAAARSRSCTMPMGTPCSPRLAAATRT